jgi:hypothetical protein
MNESVGLKEHDIPAELLPKVRQWWARQMQEIAAAHGANWPQHREWIADYLNAEVRERLVWGGE